jgi:hypothetical protein
LAGRFSGVACLHDEFSRLFKKSMTGFGEFHTPFVAGKKIDSEHLLQLPYLPAQWRLRDVQPLRGLAKIQVLRDRNEVSNVTEFHRQAFYTAGDVPAHTVLSSDTW